jgi:hypothetical protein
VTAVERTTEPIITFEATVRAMAEPAVVYEVLADISTHLDWAGHQGQDERFRLLSLEAAKGAASVGTTFTSTGASSKDGSMTFHDRSTVTEATPGRTFAFETDSMLVRKRRPTWHARFVHRYTMAPDASGSRIHYTCAVHPQNYRPYWLHPLARPATRRMVSKAMRRNLENLALMADKTLAGR